MGNAGDDPTNENAVRKVLHFGGVVLEQGGPCSFHGGWERVRRVGTGVQESEL